MSITTEIQRLRTNVNNIRQNTSDILDAIENKGVEIPTGSTLDDCAGLISQIETGEDVTGGGSSYKGVISTGFCTLTDGRYLTDFDNSHSTVTLIYGLSLNGKSVTMEFNVCITGQSSSNYSICGPNINNYITFAIQYRSTSKEIWFAAPNATQNAWQSDGWKSCDLGIEVYHKLRLEYIKDTNTLNGYVDGVLITTSQLSDIPNASSDTLKLGMNYQTQFALQGIIDLSKSYIEADGVRQFN